MPPSQPSLWSRKEVAAYLGVSEITVLRMIQNRDLAAYKVRGKWRFRPEDIDRYLREHSTVPPSKKTAKRRKTAK